MTTKYSLLNDLKQRTCKARNFTFLGSHFFLGIIFFSGLGIWIEIFKLAFSLSDSSLKNLQLALIFYSPAVFGSSGIYLLLTDQKRDMRTLILILAFILAIITLGLNLTYKNANLFIYAVFNIITILIALWVWILANSPNKDLFSDDDAEPDASTGGSTDSDVAGTTTGFKVED
ncbi:MULTISPECIES: hypothetical protein [unclassified Acinetobacter]|uniref:hypothetical protein n=1 Tax=unclassified Acinetobacter TaxID=196816 RepID=UPI0015D42B27|nr:MULTISPECIES: hypothetical protein [unclassified Acinetobacter]